jgi:prophage antirepressor-like protein
MTSVLCVADRQVFYLKIKDICILENMLEPLCIKNNNIIQKFQNNNVNIQRIDNKYLFRASDVATILNIKNIYSSVQNYDSEEKELVETETLGGCQKVLFLSSNGIYRLLFNSKKPEAKKFRIWSSNILNDINFNEGNELKKQLEEKQVEICQLKDNNEYEKKLSKHNTLVDLLKYKKCVYLQEIRFNDKHLIKVGSSEYVEDRNKSLIKEFGCKGIFLELFDCESSFRDVERAILNDKEFSKHKFRDKLSTGQVSSETVLLSEEFTYEQLLTIVKFHVNNSQYLTPREQLEMKRLDILSIAMEKNINIKDITNFINNIPDSLPEIRESLPIYKECVFDKYNTIVENEIKKTKNFGRQIQQIDPDNTSKIIKIYRDMGTLLEYNKNTSISETGIRSAINESRVYNSYRWMYVEKGEEPNIVKNIKPNQITKFNSKIIIELNQDKTELLNTFTSQKKLSEYLRVSATRVRQILDKNLQVDNKHYNRYMDCDKYIKEILDEYMKNNIVNKLVPKGAVKVKSINPITGAEIIHPSLKHAHDAFKIHHKTVHKAILEKRMCNGNYWEYA